MSKVSLGIAAAAAALLSVPGQVSSAPLAQLVQSAQVQAGTRSDSAGFVAQAVLAPATGDNQIAQHASHSSHASHGSHASHASHASHRSSAA